MPFIYFFYVLRFVIFISRTHWFILWAILELNSIIFIPILNKRKNNQEHTARITYFLTQRTASLVIIFRIFNIEINNLRGVSTPKVLMLLALLIKITRAPLHRWLPAIILSLTWTNVWLVLTIQKLIPLVLIILTKPQLSTILISCICISVSFGAIINLAQNNIKRILAYSRISHAGWFIAARTTCQERWIFYYVSYIRLLFMLKTSLHITTAQHRIKSQINSILIFITILSLGGLPPLIGFFPKVIIVNSIVIIEVIRLAVILIVFSVVDLFIYIRLSYHALTNKKSKMIWVKKEKYISIAVIIFMNVRFSLVVIL